MLHIFSDLQQFQTSGEYMPKTGHGDYAGRASRQNWLFLCSYIEERLRCKSGSFFGDPDHLTEFHKSLFKIGVLSEVGIGPNPKNRQKLNKADYIFFPISVL